MDIKDMRNRTRTSILCLLCMMVLIQDSKPPRLIGKCEGKTIWADEEDQFPYGCLKITPVKG